MATHKNAWEEVASSWEESSALEEGGALRAMDAGLFGVGPFEVWLDMSIITHDKSS